MAPLTTTYSIYNSRMTLKDSLYKIKKIDRIDNNIVVKLEILSDHPIYQGHFPEKAVVPGVCTLTIIKECLSEILGRTIMFSSIKECKYLSALLPTCNINIAINMEILDDTKIRSTVINEDNQQPVLKLRAAFL